MTRFFAFLGVRNLKLSWESAVKPEPDATAEDEARALPEEPLRESSSAAGELTELCTEVFPIWERHVETARGQMELMENTFKLLADEIVTMSTPAALGARLEDLRIGVEAIREASAGDEEAYEEEALEEAAEERRRS